MPRVLGFGNEVARARSSQDFKQFKEEKKAEARERALRLKEKVFNLKQQLKLQRQRDKEYTKIALSVQKQEFKTRAKLASKQEQGIELTEVEKKQYLRRHPIRKILYSQGKKGGGVAAGTIKSLRGLGRFNVGRPRFTDLGENNQGRFVSSKKKYSKYKNFFAHGDEEEVYGDTGLTFFDGGKRADDDTGALFGI